MRKWKLLLLPLLLVLLLLLAGCDGTQYPYARVYRDGWLENSIIIPTPKGSRFVEYDVEDDGYTIILRFAKEDTLK